jgi:RNA polymerase sigma factor (sigma-70 family)
MFEDDNILNWDKMRSGDRQAFFALYKNIYFHLVRFGLKLHADDELVKDCITQLFLKLWDKHESLPPVTNVQAYFFTALKRNILDQIQSQSRRQAADVKFTSKVGISELSYEDMIIQVQQDEELKTKLRAAMQQLTNRQSELVRLKFFEGLSYDEIATTTNQTVKTAYNTVYDAVKQLRKFLK